ncbi:hypothetical protein RQM65_01695 [Pricia sp. S334]|uniref:Uncharacterized protein n=1 Tax=Pricia mediterranea TaxID=3076079 RepID=A0ABU3L0Y6_9FLAO|nr:hypothetical protein [Pricia sp. S334]MDT7827376.1 hypothetical protein [Pricia sp. S334]
MAKKLNQLEANAICGNDISSSCLYISALAIGYAGQYVPTLLIVFFMLKRTFILIYFLQFVGYVFPDKKTFLFKLNLPIDEMIEKINQQEFVFFANHENVEMLNRIMPCMQKNEATKKLKIVSIVDKEKHVSAILKEDILVLDRIYPDIKIELIEEVGHFTSDKIQELSKRWNIPTNFMFIGSPGDKFPYAIEELGEVRLII